jgi:hypothetical protein
VLRKEKEIKNISLRSTMHKKDGITWLCAILRKMFWIKLILIMSFKILHQEMPKDGFLKSIESL